MEKLLHRGANRSPPSHRALCTYGQAHICTPVRYSIGFPCAYAHLAQDWFAFYTLADGQLTVPSVQLSLQQVGGELHV